MTGRMDWAKAKRRKADTTTLKSHRLERQADRILAKDEAPGPLAKQAMRAAGITRFSKLKKAAPYVAEPAPEEVVITYGANPDGTLRVYRFTTRADAVEWQKKHGIKT